MWCTSLCLCCQYCEHRPSQLFSTWDLITSEYFGLSLCKKLTDIRLTGNKNAQVFTHSCRLMLHPNKWESSFCNATFVVQRLCILCLNHNSLIQRSRNGWWISPNIPQIFPEDRLENTLSNKPNGSMV